MVIIDKTPYRSENGEISPIGLVQGLLKYGLSWQNRLKAQDAVIAIIGKQLDTNFALLRNVTLPNTDINLPLILIGPPGIYLINVLHERGIFKARDDQWGTMIGDRFMPARINQISRTAAFGRVLQVYLDRQGFKGSVVVESALLASDPGMQIESTRPAVRVVMSDALERFAASMNQARPMIDARLGKDLVQAILVGRPPKAEEVSVVPEPIEEETNEASFGAFSFDDEQNEPEPEPVKNQSSKDWAPPNQDESESEAEQVPAKPKKAARKKKGPLGLTTPQLITVIVVLLLAVCCIGGISIYALTQFNA